MIKSEGQTEKQHINGQPPVTPENITPYDGSRSKGEQIEEMFDHIAPAYDFMNSAMSMGQHRHWRRVALRMALAAKPEPKQVVDLATGTGDVAFALAEQLPSAEITGVDLSAGMLSVARKRLAEKPEETKSRISFQKGDCLELPFPDDSFDLLTIAYGVRNFQDLRKGLTEMRRVLRPGGVACIIELSRPTAAIPLAGYKLYTKLIPIAGKLIAGDSEAYSYLPASIAACPQRDEMVRMLLEAGFKEGYWKQLTLGALCIYIAKK